MYRIVLSALLIATGVLAAQGPKFKDNPTVLGPIQAGTLFDIDLRTLLVTPGVPPLTWTASTDMPSWLHLDSANSRLSGTPQASDSGTKTFRMSVSDSSGETGDVNHPMQVVVVAPPKWKSSPLDLGLQNEDKGWSFNLNSAVDNPAGGAVTYAINGQPQWMQLNTTSGVLSGTPRRVDVGKYAGIQITATGKGGSSKVNAFGEVLKTIKPPKWSAPDITLTPNPSEDLSYSRSLLEFVVNPEGAALRYEIVSQSPPPWLSVGQTNATLFGTPDKTNLGAGAVSVILKATIDGQAFSDTASFRFTVLHVNHPPRWVADPIVGPNAFTGVAYQQPLANSFKDPDAGDTHSFELLPGGPAWLKLDLKTGVLTGTPAKGDVGTFTWKVKVTDNSSAADTTTLQITVIKSNEPPVWVAKPTLLPDAAEDKAYEIDLNQAKYVFDGDNDPLTFTKLTGPAWAGVSSQGKLIGKPGKLDIGITKIQVKVADGVSGSDVVEIQIVVIATNHAPFWTLNPMNFSAKEDLAFSINVTPFAKDPDNDTPLTFSLVSGGSWAKLSAHGVLTGTPTANQIGDNTFKVRVSDPKGLTADADLVVKVQHVNHAPFWTQNPIVLPNAKEDQAYTGLLAGSAKDPDTGDLLTFSLVDGPLWATVGASGVLTGIPSRADVGLNTFKVRVMDPSSEFSDVTVQVTVEKVNRPPHWRQNPVLLADAFTDEAYSFSLAPYAADDDGDTLTFKLVSGPGWMKVDTAGKVTGTPLKADVGQYNAVFEVTDGKSAPVATNGNGSVIKKNKPPVIKPELPTFIVKERSVFKVSLNQPQYVEDPDGDPLSFAVLDPKPWLKLAANGDLVVDKPAFADIGLHTFRLKVDDGKIATHGELKILVVRDPRPPLWLTDPIKFNAKTNEAFSESVASQAQDLDGIPLTFVKRTGKPWLGVDSKGGLSGTPRDVDLGVNAFVVGACNDLLCADVGVLIDVKWGTKEDSYATDDAIPGARADTLWVVDNSQQCDSLIQQLKKAIPVYFNALATNQISHAGIYISADAHKWDGMPIRDTNQPRLFRWTDANLVTDFLRRVDISFSPGGCGNCYNSPIWAMERFYQHAPDLTDVYHQGYLEAGVPFDTMIVTQQVDHYKWFTKYLPEYVKLTPDDYAKRFQSFHAKEGSNLRISAITPKCPQLIDKSGDPTSAGPETAYQVLVNRTKGAYYTFSCDMNVSGFLKDYAARITSRAFLWGHRSVLLTKVPVETQSMKVYLGTTELTGNSGQDTDQWRYDGSTNSVRIFWQNLDPASIKPGDRIRVVYRVS